MHDGAAGPRGGEGLDPRDILANHLALASRWTDDLAHEIKNPFHAMVINLELVKRRAGDADAARERAEVVESELHRVHGLIDSLLKLVRPWPATDAANVTTVFDALLPVFRARARLLHLAYDHEPGDGPAVVALGPGELALVLLNLMDNAMDAASTEGSIRTRCEYGENVVVRVTDDGPGFQGLDGDPFEAGVTGREGRPGLGLAVGRRLAEDAGGSLAVDPAGEGTSLVLTLPRPTAASA